MQRVGGLLALVACACLVAGCGGAALEAKARKVAGDPHAVVLHTETVRTLNGLPMTLVLLKPSGSTGLGCIEALSYTGSSLTPGCPRTSYEAVGLNPTTHAYAGDWEIDKAVLAAIDRAKATSPRFKVFPDIDQLTIRCTIPGVSARHTLPGMCAITVLLPRKHVGCVAFSEAWRARPASKLSIRGWIVRLDRTGHVQSTRMTAHPPQPWSGHRPNTCSRL
jgi:hypothetical protein